MPSERALPRSSRRPFGAPDAWSAVATLELLAATAALSLPEQVWQVGEDGFPQAVPLPLAGQGEALAATFALGALLAAIGAWRTARPARGGAERPADPRRAAGVVVLAGLCCAGLALAYRTLARPPGGPRLSGLVLQALLAGQGASLAWLGVTGLLRPRHLPGAASVASVFEGPDPDPDPNPDRGTDRHAGTAPAPGLPPGPPATTRRAASPRRAQPGYGPAQGWQAIFAVALTSLLMLAVAYRAASLRGTGAGLSGFIGQWAGPLALALALLALTAGWRARLRPRVGAEQADPAPAVRPWRAGLVTLGGGLIVAAELPLVEAVTGDGRGGGLVWGVGPVVSVLLLRLGQDVLLDPRSWRDGGPLPAPSAGTPAPPRVPAVGPAASPAVAPTATPRPATAPRPGGAERSRAAARSAVRAQLARDQFVLTHRGEEGLH